MDSRERERERERENEKERERGRHTVRQIDRICVRARKIEKNIEECLFLKHCLRYLQCRLFAFVIE